jgi:hypothetical protein
MMPRRTLQVRFGLLAAGAFFVSGVFLLAIPNLLLLGVSSTQRASGPPPAGSGLTVTSSGVDLSQLLTGSVIALGVLMPLSVVLGWLVAGRLLRPLP